MKILIAILSCHAYRQRADALRATWLSDAARAGVDVLFFLGRNPQPAQGKPDEVAFDVDDGYLSLPQKSRAMYQWAVAREYDFVFKCDDDTYVVPERLLASGFAQYEYCGRLRGPSGGYAAPYASGFARWTSLRANRILATAEIGNDRAEDRWVGNTLHAAGIRCHLDPRYVVTRSQKTAVCYPEGPLQGHQIIAACEYGPDDMRRVHQMWLSGKPSSVNTMQIQPDGPFSRINILIKTFLRDGFLFETQGAIQQTMPGAKMVIVDDGFESSAKISLYAELRRRGHACVWLPFDSGFGAKANAGIPLLDREYTLIGSDDFQFKDLEVGLGILRMQSVLDARRDVGTVAGRVDNNPYEGFIERGPGYMKEIRLDTLRHISQNTPDGVPYYIVDHTVNYNLVRTGLLGFAPGQVHWEGVDRIGGDHFDFYEDLRRLGQLIAWAPNVNIGQQRVDVRGLNNATYGNYRARARLAIPRFLKRHNIRRYIGFDGRVDT